ncbi:MAG: hypothetical protein M1351_07350 [Candidatus Thermoplasmatota archaeon]|nr:hypothetical protein [Candidatus Thermoplasmatota archaeon]
MLDSDASAAKTLTLIALILQAVFFVVGLFLIAGLMIFSSTVTTTSPGGTTTVGPSGFGIGLFGLVFGIIFLIGLLWILLDYFLVYKNLAEEKVEEAETPSLVLGILQLLFGGFITGILLIIAYVKIRDSTRNRWQPSQVVVQPPSN